MDRTADSHSRGARAPGGQPAVDRYDGTLPPAALDINGDVVGVGEIEAAAELQRGLARLNVDARRIDVFALTAALRRLRSVLLSVRGVRGLGSRGRS